PPMAEQARLDMLARQRLLQKRILEQIDLSHRKVVGGAPVRIHLSELVLAQCCLLAGPFRRHGGVRIRSFGSQRSWHRNAPCASRLLTRTDVPLSSGWPICLR